MRCYFATPLTCTPTFYPSYNRLCNNSSKSCSLSSKSYATSSKSCTPCPSNWSRLSCLSRPCIPCCVPCRPCETVCPSVHKKKLFNVNDGFPAGSSDARKKNKTVSNNAKGTSKRKGTIKVVKVPKQDEQNRKKKDENQKNKDENKKKTNGNQNMKDENQNKKDENQNKKDKNQNKKDESQRKIGENQINEDVPKQVSEKAINAYKEGNKKQKEDGKRIHKDSKGLVGTNPTTNSGDDPVGVQNSFGDPNKVLQPGKTQNGITGPGTGEGTFPTCTPRVVCRCFQQQRGFPYSNPYQNGTSRVSFNRNVTTNYYSQQNYAGKVSNTGNKVCRCWNQTLYSRNNTNVCSSCGRGKVTTPSPARQLCSLCGNCGVQSSWSNALKNSFSRPFTTMQGSSSSYGNTFNNFGTTRCYRPSMHQGAFSRPDTATSLRSYQRCGTCGSAKMPRGSTLNNVPSINQQSGCKCGPKMNVPMSRFSLNCQVNPKNVSQQSCSAHGRASSRVKISVSQKMRLIYP